MMFMIYPGEAGCQNRVNDPERTALQESKNTLTTQCPLRLNHLDANLLFERFLLFMVRQAPAWFDTYERIKVAPNSKERCFRKVYLDLPPFFQVLEFDDVFIDIDGLYQERVGQLKWFAGE